MAIGFLANFLALYCLLRIFEPGKRDIRLLPVAAVAVLPTLIVLILGVTTSLMVSPYLWNTAMIVIAVTAVTYYLLRKVLDVPAKRSIWYAVAMASTNTLVRYLTQ